MKAVIIADSHIHGKGDPVQENLVRLLDSLCSDKNPPEVLILLGDIFEFWMGFNKTAYSNYLPTLTALKKINNAGIRIIYLEGNHDFLMGRYFTETIGVEVYPEYAVVELDGTKLYLTHGDSLDKSPRYTFWRWLVRSLPVRILNMILPSGTSWLIADKLSDKSRFYNLERGINIENFIKEYAREKLKEKDIDVFVAGHSHKATIEDIYERKKYINPGSFADNGSHVTFQDGAYKIEKTKN